MAITANIIDNVSAEITNSDQGFIDSEFTITEATTIIVDNFLSQDEWLIVWRLGPSGDYVPATNKDGTIVLGAIPNMALLDAPATYRVTKTETSVGAYVGYTT